MIFTFFFFNDTATTEIYTLSLHDALPISVRVLPDEQAILGSAVIVDEERVLAREPVVRHDAEDRKSTRLNSSHSQISYAVFCLKKKKTSHRRSLVSCYSNSSCTSDREGPA